MLFIQSLTKTYLKVAFYQVISSSGLSSSAKDLFHNTIKKPGALMKECMPANHNGVPARQISGISFPLGGRDIQMPQISSQHFWNKGGVN